MATAPLEQLAQPHYAARLMPGGWGRHLPAAHTVALHVGQRSMELKMPEDLYGNPPTVGDLFWISVDLTPHQTVRPLVQVSDVRGESILVQYRHLFPDHRAMLEEHRQAHASPQGY